MSELDLIDMILRHSLELQRLSSHEEAEAAKLIDELVVELRQLLASHTLDEAGKREVEAIIREADQAIAARYAQIPGLLDTHTLAIHVAERTTDLLKVAIPAATMPTAERLASLAKDILIDGSPASAWWARQAEDTAFKFAAQVRQGVLNGETQEQIVGRIVGRGDEPGIMLKARRDVRTLVHSSIMTAANRARLETFKKNGRHMAGIRWLATLDGHTCAQCVALDGQAWDLDGNPLKGATVTFQLPPAHFSCFSGDTPVLSRGLITGASKRWFDGDAIVIATASGREFTCTPNHPILTDRGWLAAGLLDVGSNVVCDEGGEREAVRDGDGQNAPALIHQVAEAVIDAAPMGAVPMIISAPDFHGDGGGSEIAVVWSDGLLPYTLDTSGREHLDEIGFIGRALTGLIPFAGCRHSAQRVERHRASSRGGVGGGGERLALSLVQPPHAGELLLAPVSHEDAVLMEGGDKPVPRNSERFCDASKAAALLVELDRLAQIEPGSQGSSLAGVSSPPETGADRAHLEAEIVRDLLARFPGQVACDQVVSTRRIPFHGYVYNLETSGGWYLAQGVVSHNCRCVATPIAKGLDEIFGTTGLDAKMEPATRASKDGPTNAVTFDAFLKRQTPEFVDEMLGKKRADLWRSGAITLRDLVSGTGRPLTLAELSAR